MVQDGRPSGPARASLTRPDDLAAFDEFEPRARAAGNRADPSRFACSTFASTAGA
jgi:hypothetical protein